MMDGWLAVMAGLDIRGVREGRGGCCGTHASQTDNECAPGRGRIGLTQRVHSMPCLRRGRVVKGAYVPEQETEREKRRTQPGKRRRKKERQTERHGTANTGQ